MIDNPIHQKKHYPRTNYSLSNPAIWGKVISALILLGLIGGLSIAFGNAPAAPGSALNDLIWSISPVDTPHDFDSAKLVFDLNDQPHILYGGGTLYHAWKVGLDWQVEIVDPGPGSGTTYSVVRDSSDNLHVLYHNEASGSLKYALRQGDNWSVQLITAVTSLRGGTLDLDSTERPHIIYADAGQLNYGIYNGVDWALETVTTANIQTSPVLALDAQDQPHISFFIAPILPRASPTVGINYAYRSDIWHFERVDGGSPPMVIAVGADNKIHLGYRGIGGLTYAGKENAQQVGWDIEVVDALPFLQTYPFNMVIDSLNRVHIGYGAFEDDMIKYTRQTSQGWAVHEVAVTEGAFWDGGLALDGDNQPYLVHVVPTDLTINLYFNTRLDSGNWSSEVVDSSEFLRGGDLVVGDDRNPKISYQSGTPVNNLKFSEWNGSEWTGGILDTYLSTGYESKIVLDSSDHPHILYLNVIHNAYYLAVWDGLAWSIEALDDPTLDLGVSPSIAIDSQDYIQQS